MNDFRWHQEAIEWETFLGLLEGATTKLPAPKNKYAQDITISSDVPIVCTSIGEIVKTNGDPKKRDDENFMMAARWKVFKFSRQFEEDEQKEVPSCKRCFARLALLGKPKPKRVFTFKKKKSEGVVQ